MSLLGKEVRDRITGFQGRVTGQVNYLTGCNQLLVAPHVKEDGAFRDAQWFDEQRCEVVNHQAITLDNSLTPGADLDLQAPKR